MMQNKFSTVFKQFSTLARHRLVPLALFQLALASMPILPGYTWQPQDPGSKLLNDSVPPSFKEMILQANFTSCLVM